MVGALSSPWVMGSKFWFLAVVLLAVSIGVEGR